MANQEIYPYGQGGELPYGYPIVNNLASTNAQAALAAPMGRKLAAMTHKNTIFVAASNASAEDKLAADYQCSGTNDELVIQQAVNHIYNKGGGTLMLSSGTFYIDSFPNYESNDDGGSYTAILIPSDTSKGYEIRIKGDMLPYGYDNGTKIHVSTSCYESLDSSKKYKIFRSSYTNSLMINQKKVSLMMSDLFIRLPYNQKKIMCIDLRYTNRVSLERIACYGVNKNYASYSASNPPAPAVKDCVGIRMTGGSNYGIMNDYKNITCVGFYEGFMVGGEHVIGINLGGSWNVYSFTFGNYPWADFFLHPITLINCSDERSVNYPLFAYCGYNRDNGSGGQQISLIDFNLERIAEFTPGGVLGELASELVPGTFHGDISYTIHKGAQGVNKQDEKFWKDGHGQRFISRNSTHKQACSTTERNTYAANYMQHVWDTTLNKEVICVDTANKTWKDTEGNTV